MSPRSRLVVFAAGLVGLAVLVARTGPTVLLVELLTAWWVVVPVVALWGVVYLFNAAAWRQTFHTEQRRPGRFRTLLITITSFALNYLTPVVSLGGEAWRAAAVEPWFGPRRAAGSVIQYRLLHSLAHMLFILSTVVAAAWLLPGPLAGPGILGGVALMGAGVSWVIIRMNRDGVLERGLNLLLRTPGVRRLATSLEGQRAMLREMDRQLVSTYREHPAVFWKALALEFLGRLVSALELALIILGLGLGWQPIAGMIAAGLGSAVATLFFFVPFELGAREAGLYLAFGLLGVGAEHGVAAALLSRLRELIWAVTGLGLVWAAETRRTVMSHAID